jgi:hypothetical protein
MRFFSVCRSTMNFPFLVLSQLCVKPRKSKVSGFPLAAPSPSLDRKAAELDKARLIGVQLQAKLRQSLAKFHQELLGVRLVLKPSDDVVGVTHEDDISPSGSLTPVLSPQVEGVVEVDLAPNKVFEIVLAQRPTLALAPLRPTVAIRSKAAIVADLSLCRFVARVEVR